MLSPDVHCQMLNDQTRDRNAIIMDAFKSFVTTFTAITGGSVALRVSSYPVNDGTVFLANLLVILCGIASAIIIADNYRAWYQYRKRLNEIAGIAESGEPVIPAPKLWSSIRVEVAMLLVILVTCLLFLAYNPLRVPATPPAPNTAAAASAK